VYPLSGVAERHLRLILTITSGAAKAAALVIVVVVEPVSAESSKYRFGYLLA